MKEINTLIFKAYHHSLSEAEHDEFIQWVLASPNHARQLVEYSALTSGIKAALRSQRIAKAGDSVDAIALSENVFDSSRSDEIQTLADEFIMSGRHERLQHNAEDVPAAEHDLDNSQRIDSGLEPSQHTRMHKPSFKAVLKTAVVSGLAALLGLAFWIVGQEPARTKTELAVSVPASPGEWEQPPQLFTPVQDTESTDSYDVQWIYFNGRGQDTESRTFTLGGYGLVCYKFADRESILIEGRPQGQSAVPTEYQLVNNRKICLIEGRLVAKANEDSLSPLTIQIDNSEITVHGGEFGIFRISPDKARLIVFEGSIQVFQTLSTNQASRLRLNAGQMSILNTNLGTLESPTPFTQNDATAFCRSADGFRRRPSRTTKTVQYLADVPESVLPSDLENTYRARLFCESTGIQLNKDDIPSWPQNQANLGGILPGQALDSYLLHFDPQGKGENGEITLHGTIIFDRPIQAVLASPHSILATNPIFTSPQTIYSHPSLSTDTDQSHQNHGIEWDDNDAVSLSEDRRSLHFRLKAGRDIDQLRILVQAR